MRKIIVLLGLLLLFSVGVNVNAVQINDTTLTLLTNTNQCLSDCEAWLEWDFGEVSAGLQVPSSQSSSWKIDFVKKSLETPDLLDWGTEIWKEKNVQVLDYCFQTEFYEIPLILDVNGGSCASVDCEVKNPTTCRCSQEVYEVCGSHIERKWQKDADDFFGYHFERGDTYRIKIWGTKQAKLGENDIDWIATFDGQEITQWEWWDSNVSYKQKLTLHTSDILSSDIANAHVILVDINAANTDFWENVEPDGKDVRFVNADENGLFDYHFERFDSDNNRMIAWVEIDSFTSASNVELYVYYGNSEATDAQDETGTYPAAYEAVWHMADDSSPQHDSTNGAFDLTHTNTPTLEVAGKIGNAIDYDKVSDESSYNATVMDGTTTQFSISWWFKKSIEWNPGSASSEYILDKQNIQNVDIIRIKWEADGALWSNNKMGNVGSAISSSKTTWAANTWFNIVIVMDSVGNKHTLYVNGSTTDGADSSPAFNAWQAGTTTDFLINAANSALPSSHADQVMDEIRIFYDTALTADEVALLYASENITLIEFGSQESNNTAPTWVDIDLNITYAKNNDDIKVTATGTADGQSDDITLLCGTETAPTTDTNNFCTSFGIASPYSTVECIGTGTTGDENKTVYCRLYDGVLYSAEKTWDYIADNTAPATIHNNFTSGWVNVDANIQFNCFDAGAGCQDFYYTVDDVNLNEGWGEDGNFGIVLTSDGNHEIFYWSVDSLGLIEILEPTYYAIDKTAPTIQYVFPAIDLDSNTALVTFLVKLDEVGKCYYGIFINGGLDYNSSIDSNSDFVCVINYFGFIAYGDTTYLITNSVEDELLNSEADVWKTGTITYVKPAGVVDATNIENEDIINVGWFIAYKSFAGIAIFLIPFVGLLFVFAIIILVLKK